MTSSSAIDIHPSWHPDGTRILWVSERHGLTNLYCMELGSRRVTQLSSGESIYNPAISPDGRYLAFVSRTKRSVSLRLHRLRKDATLGALIWSIDGKVQRWAGYRPRFSPDSRWLGFEAPREPAGGDIFAVPVDNPGAIDPVRLTALPFQCRTTEWWDWLSNDRIVLSIGLSRRYLLKLPDADRAVTELLGT